MIVITITIAMKRIGEVRMESVRSGAFYLRPPPCLSELGDNTTEHNTIQHHHDTMKSQFKDDHSLEHRKEESARIRAKFSDRIPVICERVEDSDIPNIDKRKYLVPSDLTVGQFVYVIRRRIHLPSEKAIFIFVKDILPPTAALMSTIYDQYKDEDGFLYVVYSGENTFGMECI